MIFPLTCVYTLSLPVSPSVVEGEGVVRRAGEGRREEEEEGGRWEKEEER